MGTKTMKTFPQICPVGHHEHLPWAVPVTAWCEACRKQAAFTPVPQETGVTAAERVDIQTHARRRFNEIAETREHTTRSRPKANSKEELTVQRLLIAGLPKRHIDHLKEMDAAGKEAARRVDEALSVKGPVSVLLWGDFGRGKTQVAAAVSMLRAQRNEHTRYLSCPDLMRQLRDNMKLNVPEGVFLRKYQECACLILDDIHISLDDSPDNVSWARGQMQSLLDVRYRSNAPRKTIFIANAAGEDELKRRIGGQMLSRIGEDGKVLRLNSKDYRAK